MWYFLLREAQLKGVIKYHDFFPNSSAHTQQNPANIMQERKQFHSKDSKGAYFGTQLRHKTKKQLNNEWAWLNRMGDYFRQHRST